MPKHTYKVRDATEADAEELGPKLRQADIDELKASSDIDPLDLLKSSVTSSYAAKAGLVDGEVICLFGVVKLSLVSFTGIPWLLASSKLEKHARLFLRGSKLIVSEMRKNHSYLYNFVDVRNKHAIRWLKWLGFSILPAKPHGPRGFMFHKFEMKRK